MAEPIAGGEDDELGMELRRPAGDHLRRIAVLDEGPDLEVAQDHRLGGPREVLEWFVANKRAEWDEYRSYVTQYEIERNLPRL